MRISHTIILLLLAAGISACNERDSGAADTAPPQNTNEEQTVTEETAAASETIEIAPGLSAEIVQKGYGRVAQPGDFVEVHYTGWLYDEQAEGKRGNKFDSSVDRGEKFSFKLGAGQVIKGWDQGVAGMLIGEKRVLTIAPDMGYGSRGAGGVIPPNATLIFEVELFGLEGPND